VATLLADPSKVEEIIRMHREQALTRLRQQTGFAESRLLADRTSGTMMSVTLWANEAAAQAADPLNQSRTQAAQLSGAPMPSTAIFEKVSNETARGAAP
jgi:hypothetical protein